MGKDLFIWNIINWIYFFGKQVDVRADEEQQIKLQQCLELLVAAGYFRARIQGLPPFDKVNWKK